MNKHCFDNTLAVKTVGKFYSKSELVNINNKRDYVVLVPGLGLSRFFFSKASAALENKGYTVTYCKYPTTKFSLEVLSNQFLSTHIKHNCSDKKKKIHFVTHSLGGIVVRKYLSENPSLRVGKVVMIAPPHHGAKLATIFKNFTLFKYLFGPAGQQLGSEKNSYIRQMKSNINYDLGIIAGNRCINPFSFFLIKEPNDGLVSVKSTKIKGMKDHITLRSSHLLLLKSAIVINQMINFIEKGLFTHKDL